MVNTMPQGKVTVTHSGTDYELNWDSIDVILVENAMAQTIISTVNRDDEVFQDRADIGDNLKVELRYLDEGTSWRQPFGGWIFDLAPTLTMTGEMMTLTARDYGLGLAAMLVGEQYGTESENTTLNTISEVLTDASKGIIPKWCQKVLNTATDSGYSFNTTKVAAISSDFRYLYWAYKPALNCINDMIDLISAANAPNAGVHWIVVPSGTTAYLCLATVGAHENPPADVWPTWFNTDQAGSTIEVKKDMIVTRFTKQRSDANYVLYHGEFRKPVDGDKWTEQTPMSSYWFGSNCTIGSDSGVDYVKVGSNSLRAQPDESVTGLWRYPYNGDATWNLSAIGGKLNIPSLNFYMKIDSNIEAPINIRCVSSGVNNYYQYNLEQNLSDQNGSLISGEFFHINIPIGPYAKQAKTAERLWTLTGSPNWNAIIYIIFRAKSKTGQVGRVNVDGLHFAGWILRGARDDTKIGTQKARVKLIMDDVAKDDSTSATDDAYVMAQLSKAELYRSISAPIIGEISIPGIPGSLKIMPGQLAHIHHGKKSSGSFSIDKDMRILQVRHRFEQSPHGLRTYLTLTDDVKNSRALMPNIGYNLLVKAANPEFLNRETASRKTREIDLSQTILSKNYST